MQRFAAERFRPEDFRDDENRLASVTGGGHTTTFTCDADGALVKKVVDGQTTVYPSASLRPGVGNYYEKNLSSGEVRTYYYFNGSRIAMRVAGVLYYIVGDHPSLCSGQVSAPPAWS